MPRAGHQKEKDKNMESQKNITIYDIAQATNLSIATISRIINKKGRYSAETESRVIKAMEELGYTPSASAQSLAKIRRCGPLAF